MLTDTQSRYFDSTTPPPSSAADNHEQLAAFNRQRLQPSIPTSWPAQGLMDDLSFRLRELEFVEHERRQIATLIADVPHSAEPFVGWFENLRGNGPGEHDRLFDWLAESATLEQMIWFLSQEVAGEAGFEDLVALTQLQLPKQAKLELARNYWDEMGRGSEGGMHGGMLSSLADALGLPMVRAPIVWEARALSNLMIALAMNRFYCFQSLGALGVIELTAPWRAERVNLGLKRLGVSANIRRYYAVHATLDIKHSEAWNREILLPLVRSRPEIAHHLAEGAILRLQAGLRCFERYRCELGID